MRAAADLALGEQREEALDLVEPGGRGRGEVDVPARSLGEPVADQLGLVAAGVGEDDVHLEIGRYARRDGVEEAAELLGAVARETASDDGAGGHVESGEQRGRAVAPVVVRAALHLAGAQGQERLGAVERLDLALLVDAQNQRAVRRIEIQPDDVPHLLDEHRIAGELKGLDPMRLQREGLPDAMDGGGREAGRLGHRAQAPMGRVRGRRLQRALDHFGNLGVADRARRARPRLVRQPVEPGFGKAGAPLADGMLAAAERRRDRLVDPALRRQQHDPRAPRQGLRRPLPAHQRLQFRSFPVRQRDLDRLASRHTALLLDQQSMAETYRSGH